MRIISASRREDMPAFRIKRLVEAFHDPKYADSFWVLWTKDPSQLLRAEPVPGLPGLDPRVIALQLTITGLGGSPFEPGVPPPAKIIAAVKELIARGYDPRLINWRLDPILKGVQTPAMVTDIAQQLAGVGITRCVVSFPTFYQQVTDRWEGWKMHDASEADKKKIIQHLHELLAPLGFQLFGCTQPDLSRWLTPSRCIDGDYYSSITGFDFSSDKDKYQRPACGCTESIDIGSYRPCAHRCIYCYARPADEPTNEQPSLF